jgi:hypothetical protein
MRLAVDLHEHLVEVPLPVMKVPHTRDAAPTDLGREDRPEPVPRERTLLVIYLINPISR